MVVALLKWQAVWFEPCRHRLCQFPERAFANWLLIAPGHPRGPALQRRSRTSRTSRTSPPPLLSPPCAVAGTSGAEAGWRCHGAIAARHDSSCHAARPLEPPRLTRQAEVRPVVGTRAVRGARAAKARVGRAPARLSGGGGGNAWLCASWLLATASLEGRAEKQHRSKQVSMILLYFSHVLRHGFFAGSQRRAARRS